MNSKQAGVFHGGLLLGAVVFFALSAAAAHAGGRWEVGGEEEFTKGELDGVSVLSSGELVLAPTVDPISGLDANYVWDIKYCSEGRALVAAGAPGSAYVVEGNTARLLHRTSEDHALSILPLPDRSVLLGTAPRGIIYRITEEGNVTVFADLDVNYVWDMDRGEDGLIYCATGPHGQLIALTMDGQETELFQAPHGNLLCLAADRQRKRIYVGTQPGGIVYQVGEDGDVAVLFDAEENEIRDMVLAPDGAIYISTAQSERSPVNAGHREAPQAQEGSSQIRAPDRSARSDFLPGRPAVPNSIYRIDPDTGAYKMAQFHEAVVPAIACWKGGEEVLAGTGVDGRLIGVRKDGRTRVITQTGARHVSALCKTEGGVVLVGTSNPGQIMRVHSDYREKGTYTSHVFDADYLSRWGTMHWLAALPRNTSVDLFARTGNTGEPDRTWSRWAGPAEPDRGASLDLPMGRFAQVRIILGTEDGTATPEMNQFSLHYRQTNRRPVIERLEVDGQDGARNGAGRSSALKITWDASDPNEDELEADLFYRGVQEENWKELETGMREESSFRWDTVRVPDGHYLVRLRVSDHPARSSAEALQDEKVIGPLLVDNTPPAIRDLKFSWCQTEGRYIMTGYASDSVSTITSIRVSHNAGDWQPVFPDDGLFDSPHEEFTFAAPELETGEHVFVFIAEDSAGNTGSGKIVIVQ